MLMWFLTKNDEDIKQGDYFHNSFQHSWEILYELHALEMRSTKHLDSRMPLLPDLHTQSKWEVAAWHINNPEAKLPSEQTLLEPTCTILLMNKWPLYF